MIIDKDKDQKLECDIINAVKARGLQESMQRWAKFAPKQHHRKKAVDMILVSAAAVVLVLIVVNVAIMLFRYQTDIPQQDAPEEQTVYYCETKENDTVQTIDTTIVTEVKSEVRKTKPIEKIALPNITLRRYISIRYTVAPKDNDPRELMRQAEIHWNNHDYASSAEYSKQVIDLSCQTESAYRFTSEMLDYAELYYTLAIIYLENPNFKKSTILKLEQVSQLPYTECQQAKMVLDAIKQIAH